MGEPVLLARGQPPRPEAPLEGEREDRPPHRPLRAGDPGPARGLRLNGPRPEASESPPRSAAAEPGCYQVRLSETEAPAPEGIMNGPRVPTSMARFPEAERRRLLKMICMQCYARNAMRATRCRKCGSRELRPKAKEARKE